jgi:tRNA(adenine34) deaminase
MGEAFSEGLNRAETNPVWHTEIGAIINRAEAHPDVELTRLALYTTRPSSVPCVLPRLCGAASRVPQLEYGTSIETLNGMVFLRLDLSIEEIARGASFALHEIAASVLGEECDALFEEMVRRIER